MKVSFKKKKELIQRFVNNTGQVLVLMLKMLKEVEDHQEDHQHRADAQDFRRYR